MAIERRVSDRPWPATLMKDALSRAHTQVWGLRNETTGDLIGFAVVSLVADEAELLLIAIDLPYQRQGYGSGLLSFVLQEAYKKGAISCFLEVSESNQAAQALYSRYGFKLNYIRSQYYPALSPNTQPLDAWVMSRMI